MYIGKHRVKENVKCITNLQRSRKIQQTYKSVTPVLLKHFSVHRYHEDRQCMSSQFGLGEPMESFPSDFR